MRNEQSISTLKRTRVEILSKLVMKNMGALGMPGNTLCQVRRGCKKGKVDDTSGFLWAADGGGFDFGRDSDVTKKLMTKLNQSEEVHLKRLRGRVKTTEDPKEAKAKNIGVFVHEQKARLGETTGKEQASRTECISGIF